MVSVRTGSFLGRHRVRWGSCGTSAGRATSGARRTSPSIVLSYLYTAFMRISEIADKGRTRPRNDPRLLPAYNYDEMKRNITELYNRQTAEEKYDVVELF